MWLVAHHEDAFVASFTTWEVHAEPSVALTWNRAADRVVISAMRPSTRRLCRYCLHTAVRLALGSTVGLGPGWEAGYGVSDLFVGGCRSLESSPR